jgi:hypothetical protein
MAVVAERIHRVRMMEDGGETIIAVGHGLEYEEGELINAMLGSQNHDEPVSYITLLEQARKILDHMWCGMERVGAENNRSAGRGVEGLAVLTILNLETCAYQLPPGLVKTAVFLLSSMR